MATPEKYKHIDFKPPNGVAVEAEYGLKLRREFKRGGTAIGVARARDLSNRKEVSPSTVKRMKAFFDRHASDSKAEGFRQGEKGFPSAGKIADLLWGGPSGYSWAKKVVKQMEAADKKEKDGRSLRPFGSSHGMEPKITVVYGPPASGKSTYVDKHRGDNDVIFDFDKIMKSLSGLEQFNSNENLISYCMDIRTLIINKALRSSKVDRTWIITTFVRDELRESLKDVPVEYVEMETTKCECLDRIEKDPRRPESHKEVLDKYFSDKKEDRSLSMKSVERRYIGNFKNAEKAEPSDLAVERRTDEASGIRKTVLVGYAAKFGSDSLLLGDFIERIAPDAFEIVDKGKDLEGKPLETRGLFNHDPNHLIGRFPETMRLTVDSKGLRYEITLPDSRSDIAELVNRGDLRGSSFSFVVADGGEKWSTEDGQSIRTVTKIKSLLDCGPVTYPAYGDSTVAVAKRSYEDYLKSSRNTKSKPKAKRRAHDFTGEMRSLKSFLEERTTNNEEDIVSDTIDFLRSRR